MHLPQSIRTPKNYRPDIDGLRAVAVVLVVIYHAFPTVVPGGFIGVDVFFVISGYLISTIILEAQQQSRFSLLAFYASRARRILPALALILLVTFIAGWVLLLPDQFSQLGLHIVGSAAFFQNVLLMREAGYFDQSSELKPLNHLWSLGVEEQFYLAYPLLLLVLARAARFRWIALSALALASFGLNIGRISVAPVETFFLLPSRLWELMAGGMLSLFTLLPSQSPTRLFFTKIVPAKTKNWASIAGLALIIAGAFMLDSGKPFPGWLALVPVAGAALIILAGPESICNRLILSHPLAILIGLISYPLYLWHWPLLAFSKLSFGENISIIIRLTLVFGSFFLAYATYRLLEMPLRFGSRKQVNTLAAVSATFIVGALGAATIWQDGFGFRDPERQEFIAFFENTPPKLQYMMANDIWQKNRIDCNFFDAPAWRAGNPNPPARQTIAESCTIPKTPRSILIWGDSHAAHLYHGLRHVLPPEISVLIVATSGCVPNLPGRTQPPTETCERSTALALETARREKPEVVMLAHWKGHGVASPLDEIAATLRAAGVKRVVQVGPVPQWEPLLYRVMASSHWYLQPKRISSNLKPEPFEADTALALRSSAKDSLWEFASLVKHLCNAEGCVTYIGDKIREGLITYDYGHLTPDASIMIARELLGPLILQQAQPQSRELRPSAVSD